MALATIEAIRDRIATLLESQTPTTDSTKFRRYRNELGANFVEWAEANAAGCLRRFQVRSIGDDSPPLVSNVQEERVPVSLLLAVAYPQTHRYGGANGMDRDDVIEQDWLKINYSVGLYGRGNFSSTHDCTPLGGTKSIDRANGVDFLVVELRYEFERSLT